MIIRSVNDWNKETRILTNQLCQVELSLDPDYKIGQPGPEPYDLVLNPDEAMPSDDWYTTVRIRVRMPHRRYRLALVCDTYGSVKLDRFAVLQGTVLSIVHGFAITRFDLEAGQAVSEIRLDTYLPNYSFYPIPGGYVLHGEGELTMFSEDWEKKWCFESRDIFFTPNDALPVEIREDRIVVRDFMGGYFELDFQGNVLMEGSYPL